MRTVIPAESKPDSGRDVLIIGWGEARKHYIYSLGQYRQETACNRWVDTDGDTLWFEPWGWCELPEPGEVAA